MKSCRRSTERQSSGPCRSRPRARRSARRNCLTGDPLRRSRTSYRARSPRCCGEARPGSPCAAPCSRAHSIAAARSPEPTPRPRRSSATVIRAPRPEPAPPEMQRPDHLAVRDGDERSVECPARGARLDVDRRLRGDPVALLRDRGEQNRDRQAVVVERWTDLEPRAGHDSILACGSTVPLGTIAGRGSERRHPRRSSGGSRGDRPGPSGRYASAIGRPTTSASRRSAFSSR